MNKIRSIQPESLRLSHYSAPCALYPPCHIRKYSCVVSMQSAEKSTGASAAQALWDAACPVEELHE